MGRNIPQCHERGRTPAEPSPQRVAALLEPALGGRHVSLRPAIGGLFPCRCLVSVSQKVSRCPQSAPIILRTSFLNRSLHFDFIRAEKNIPTLYVNSSPLENHFYHNISSQTTFSSFTEVLSMYNVCKFKVCNVRIQYRYIENWLPNKLSY